MIKTNKIAIIILVATLIVCFSVVYSSFKIDASSVSPAFLEIIGGVALIVVIFLILREFLTWYWKLNKIVALLEKIEKNTRLKDNKGNEEGLK